MSTTKLIWETDATSSYSREVAHLGMFELAVTMRGASSIGVNVFVATFAGTTVAVSGSFAECQRAALQAAKRELLRAGVELGQVLP